MRTDHTELIECVLNVSDNRPLSRFRWLRVQQHFGNGDVAFRQNNFYYLEISESM